MHDPAEIIEHSGEAAGIADLTMNGETLSQVHLRTFVVTLAIIRKPKLMQRPGAAPALIKLAEHCKRLRTQLRGLREAVLRRGDDRQHRESVRHEPGLVLPTRQSEAVMQEVSRRTKLAV